MAHLICQHLLFGDLCLCCMPVYVCLCVFVCVLAEEGHDWGLDFNTKLCQLKVIKLLTICGSISNLTPQQALEKEMNSASFYFLKKDQHLW